MTFRRAGLAKWKSMHKPLGIAFAVLLLGAACFTLFKISTVHSAYPEQGQSPQQVAKRTYRFATGNPKGIYYSIGNSFSKFDFPGFKFQADSTAGSRKNLEMVKNGDADFAMVQSDLVQKEFDSANPYFYVIAALYIEPMQICIREGLHLERLQELRGKRISLGEAGSGTVENAIDALGASGMTLSDFDIHYLRTHDAIESLTKEAIDAAFFTSGTSHPGIREILEKKKAYLLALDANTIKLLLDEFPYLVLCEIPKKAYPNMKGSITSVGVTACLICSSRNLPIASDIDTLLHFLYGNSVKQLAKDTTKHIADVLQEMSVFNAVDGIDKSKIGLLLHPAALAFFKGHYIFLYGALKKSWNEFYPGAGLILLFAFFYFKRLRMAKLLNSGKFLRNFGKIIIAILIVLLPTGVILFYLERGVNKSFSNLGESLWSIIVYLVSGFENRAPLTYTGKIISIFSILAGAVLASFFTGVMAAIQMKGLFMKDEKLNGAFHDHVIILGWNEKAHNVVKEVLDWGRDVVVMCECEGDVVRNGLVHFAHRIRCIKGNPRLVENLQRLRFDSACSILLLSNRNEDADRDYLTLHTLIQVRNLAQSMNLPRGKPHVAVEITDPGTKDIMYKAGADEVVCTSDLGQTLLVNCVINPGISLFYEDLLRISDESNEIYYADVPNHFYGKSYKHLCSAIAQQFNDNDPIIPVGLKRGNLSIDTNPRNPQEKLLIDGDKVVVIAFDRSSLGQLKNLKGI